MSLRTLFTLDALASGAMAVLLLGAFRPLADWLDLPESLLLGAGILLVPWVAFLAWMTRQAPIDRALSRVVVAVNGAWVIASVAVMLGIGVDPNASGMAFIAAQATAVAILTALQAGRLNDAADAVPSR